MKERVLVAMSGGVDSSMAACLLKKQGYEVIGVTMHFKSADAERKSKSQSFKNIEEAARTAHKLGINHYVVNMQRILNENVIKDFCIQYTKGRTPNPCIRCNQYIKFGALLKKAKHFGAKFLATGHYARIIKTKEGYQLIKGRDELKDQSYFLYRLNQRQLRNILFPIGDYTKKEVGNLAKKFNLPSAYRSASQEICFLENEDYRKFIKDRIKSEIKPGYIVDGYGNRLGRHKGIAFYTIGQREGLGIAKGYALYIIKIIRKNNQIVVGPREEAFKKEFLVSRPHFILKPIKKKIALRVRIRYNHKEELAEIMPFNKKIRVKFKKPQFAITPGQSAVFYDRNMVIGGGIIDEVSEDMAYGVS